MAAFARLRFCLQQLRFRRRASKTPLAHSYDVRFPEKHTPFLASRFLVVDCEMSGLNSDTHQLLSIGWVAIEQGRIQYASAKDLLINAEGGSGDSVLIHGLHDDMLAAGSSLNNILTLLVEASKHSILVFHHAPIDLQFLQRAAHQQFHCPLLFPYLDTLAIEKKKMERQGKHGGLRLQQCRKRYGLPETSQHNALGDAFATAELFLAQAHYMDNTHSLCLSHLPLQCS